MEEQFVKATESAIMKTIAAFQSRRGRYWNERDLHWILFHQLSLHEVFKRNDPLALIRAEFPTTKVYGEKNPARGHYDLAILDPVSYDSEDVNKLAMDAPWQEYLDKVRVLVTVEIKLWQARSQFERVIKWDVQKLTDIENRVVHGYFLNFIQLDFSKPRVKKYYRDLREHLICWQIHWPALKILCVPSETMIQPNPSENWLSPL